METIECRVSDAGSGGRYREVTWFKIDDSFHSHPKTLQAGNAAIGLWTRCGSYCAQHLTDGFVPADLAALYGTPSLAVRLERAGLWVPGDGGWVMHDYSAYNPTAERVLIERAGAASRQRRARQHGSSRRDNGVTDA
jgi:hypothetical protein